MILDPDEVYVKRFSKSMGGYDEQEVTDYLRTITNAYHELYQQYSDLKRVMRNVDRKRGSTGH